MHGAYQFVLESKTMNEKTCSESAGFPGVAAETRMLLYILALGSPPLVPGSNGGASNLGESE